MSNIYHEGFERVGEAEVRARLNNGMYRAGTKVARAAIAWLTLLDHSANEQERERRRQELELAVQTAQTAKSSAHAAWASVAVSIMAFIVAVIALCVSLSDSVHS